MDRARYSKLQEAGVAPLGVYPQQIVARIKRSSKYWGQTAPNEWFEVRIVKDSYPVKGLNNQYRLIDVALGVRLADGEIVQLSSR